MKYSTEYTTFVIGNGAGETTVFPIAAGSWIAIDASGLHYNRKSHHVRRAQSRGLQRATQHGTGKIHLLSNRKDSWVNGIGTLLSHSLAVPGPASVAGKSLTLQFQKVEVPHHSNLGSSRRRGWLCSRLSFSITGWNPTPSSLESRSNSSRRGIPRLKEC